MGARLQREVASGRLTPDSAQAAAAARLDSLREALPAPAAGVLDKLGALLSRLPGMPSAPAARGLYLWGGVGRGKTMLMDFFFESLKDGATKDSPGLAERSHFYHFMRDVHAGLAAVKQHADPLDRVAHRLAARARVICLDEFFVSDIADAMILSGLFEGLFKRGIILVTTSNVAPHNLYKDGLQRQRFLPAIDLIERHVDVIHLDGGIDFRLRQLEQAPTYLDSADPHTAAALEQRFATLASGAMTGSTVLNVEGRTLRALNNAPGTVWFTFDELCRGPRSQNDYIELAHLYHTLFISDVPLFETTDEDAARRFIMLIDELYDRGVKVVVSAAAAPVALYRGERLKFEFERAASRLIEMQTQHYLAGEHRP